MTADQPAHDDGLALLDRSLQSMVDEALEHRITAILPPVGASSAMVQESLHAVRQRLDRVEELLGKALTLRARAHSRATNAQHVLDDAWDLAAQRRRTAPVAFGAEYTSARERNAEANLATLDQRAAQRIHADAAQRCDNAVEFLRLTYRGLEGIRQDHHMILRALQFESSLDR